MLLHPHPPPPLQPLLRRPPSLLMCEPHPLHLYSGRRQASSCQSRVPLPPPLLGAQATNAPLLLQVVERFRRLYATAAVAYPRPLLMRLAMIRFIVYIEPDAAGHSYSLRPVCHYVSPSGATVAHGYCIFQAEGIS
ncbi:hypothetical protein EJB05_49560 [Eragrostis curvula]|uniref:Uncharacterized protein n=1 Tax=Eragrostis curvula TaxID=38414 RepID=A0A5J9T738_9POAL|nr:hypothetical protein EJB05_49560 [Eragrostis curvula]